MRGVLRGVTAVAIAFGVLTSQAAAQASFGLGGGPTFSLEEGGGTDFHGMASIGFGGGGTTPVGFRIDGMYQFGDAADLIIGTANLVFGFRVAPETTFRPYLIGGGGVYHTRFDEDVIDNDLIDNDTDLGANAGAGFTIPLSQTGTARLFAEGRFHLIFSEGNNISQLPVTVGFMFGGPDR